MIDYYVINAIILFSSFPWIKLKKGEVREDDDWMKENKKVKN